ncbi:MAG: bifunctional hydroxymethylpyrimidine kinase/phosphomethylpyrimidine kinase [Hyphomicrobium sp.]|nr:bifunctional hydroxymethylpyrimidine kinase/phosphomethylpyrimidine kinase [Hyphomicrobium sp.]
MIPNVLSIAGSDPGGGAGIQADLKTFAALRCHGLTVVTALTAQNTQGVFGLLVVPPDFVAAQIDALFADSEISAVKIGMVASVANVEILAERLARYKPKAIVLDPVLAASSGASLAIGAIAESMVAHLAPLVTLVTPNFMEAAHLAKAPMPEGLADMEAIAKRLHELGFAAVLVKGGHRVADTCDDILYDGSSFRVFTAPRVSTRHTHGTGCTLSSAVAAYLAQGRDLAEAVAAAKLYLQRALETADALNVGHGPGPLNHFYGFW